MTYRGRASRLAVITGFLALSATSAQAGTIEVPKEKGTIQKAVDAAGEGDTIEVSQKPNSYFENVVVTQDKIAIKGKGDPVLDAEGRAGNNPGLPFDIDANRVDVSGFVVRHGAGIDCTGRGCSFSDLNVRMSDSAGGDCIEVDGPEARISRSKFDGCDDQIIDVNGGRFLISDNTGHGGDNGCVELDGSKGQVEGNRIENCEDGNGFRLDGDENQLFSNEVRSASDNAYELTGDKNVLVDNDALNTSDDCYDIDGVRAVMFANRAEACDGGFEVSGENMLVIINDARLIDDGDGFDINCGDRPGGKPVESACVNAQILANTASGNNDDDEGFAIFADGATDGGMEIRDNQTEDNNDGGFSLDVHDSVISRNSSIDDGAEGNESGIEVTGPGNLVERNRVVSAGEHGIEISAPRNRVVGNTVTDSNADGIFVNAGVNRTRVVENLARANLGDGIENDGDETRLIGNRSEDNRRDCANDGTIDKKRGNRCADGSNFEKPGTIDRAARRG